MRRPQSPRLRLDSLEIREVPANVPLLAFGADAGAAPRVRVLERDTGAVRFDLLAFGPGFRGGVRVAVGDVTGDGQDDVIAGTGPGAAPVVKVFDGATGRLVTRFLPAAPAVPAARPASAFYGGLTVAAGDLDGDGRLEVVTGLDAGAGPRVSVHDGVSGRQLATFLAGPATSGAGVRVAAGDLEGDGRAEIVVGPASGPGTTVRVYDGTTRMLEANFSGLSGPNAHGVHVAVADTDGDGQAEVVVGAGSSARVEIHAGRTGSLVHSFTAAVPGAAGVRVGGALISTDGRADVLAGSGTTGAWAAHDGSGKKLAAGSHERFPTGLWVAGSPEQAAVNRHAAGVVLDWNAAALDAIRADRTPPPKASRALAILQTAVFDAVNGVARGFDHYHVAPDAPVGASIRAAAIAAAHTTLTSLFPNQAAQFDTLRAAGLATVADGPAKDDGIAWGQEVAGVILAARADDGSADNPPYTPGSDPGDWQPTPPANAPALLPGWGDVTPFGIGSTDPFISGPPPELASEQYATEFNEVKELGSKTSATRTADQTEIALFWADGAGTFTPPGHWNAIAAQLAEADGLSLLTTARLFAHLDVAEADAAIVCWDTKFTYNLWRPVTAIRNADADGNDQTAADPAWEPLIATPPFPAYTSGHSTFSGAAAAILSAYFGADRAFSTQGDNGAVTRSFTSFTQAAEEAGMSRIYGGIHFQSDNVNGLACGRDIAAHVLANLLQSR